VLALVLLLVLVVKDMLNTVLTVALARLPKESHFAFRTDAPVYFV